ncbi:MAG TPA: hypothetical protein VHC63_08025 [Acidimicrobiales bacterium]|nr:hypothetical protein [Acidimicrobiales bacterium]
MAMSVQHQRPVVSLSETAARVGVLLLCLALSFGAWYGFTQIILRVIA